MSYIFIIFNFVLGGLIQDRKFVKDVHNRIKKLCKELLPEAVALVDAIAPPDFVLQSVLGKADGKVSLIWVKF